MQIAVAPPPPCFLKGTRIQTPDGEVPVESLEVGDEVLTRSGHVRPVRWIGHRRFSSSTGTWPQNVIPVRIRRGALGPEYPSRDLFLSPGHMIYIDGYLIPVKHLVDGVDIAQAVPGPDDVVDYFHIELPEHDLLMSESVPTGSLRAGSGKRERFGNFAEYARLYPDDDRAKPAPCAEIRPAGLAKILHELTGQPCNCAVVKAIRRKLADRAAAPAG